MRSWLVVTVLVSCVPTARTRPSSDATLNQPPPAGRGKTAAGVIKALPTAAAPAEPLAPTHGQRGVPGHWRWTGVNYRWVRGRNEPQETDFVWHRGD